MPEPDLNLVVVRCAELEATQRFYEALGLAFVAEQHGHGPAHLAATLPSGLVLELYPSVGDDSPAGIRLCFAVDDVARVATAACRAGGTEVRSTADRVVLTDPDGRTVELGPRANADMAAVAEAYWRHYLDPEADDWAWELVDAVGRDRAPEGAPDALHLFGELATSAADDQALAYLGAGPLENHLRSTALDLGCLAVAVRENVALARAFTFAYLPRRLPAEDLDRLKTILSGWPA